MTIKLNESYKIAIRELRGSGIGHFFLFCGQAKYSRDEQCHINDLCEKLSSIHSSGKSKLPKIELIYAQIQQCLRILLIAKEETKYHFYLNNICRAIEKLQDVKKAFIARYPVIKRTEEQYHTLITVMGVKASSPLLKHAL